MLSRFINNFFIARYQDDIEIKVPIQKLIINASPKNIKNLSIKVLYFQKIIFKNYKARNYNVYKLKNNFLLFL